MRLVKTTALGSDRLEPCALDGRPFPAETCDRLFAAVLIDDDIDPDLRLPRAVEFDHDEATLIACFRLSRQLWIEGCDWTFLATFAERAIGGAFLSDEDRLRFKHIRAKFKHFRYAHALFDADHRYPRLLNAVAIAMGKLQDASRVGGRRAIIGRGALLRLLVTGVVARRVQAEGDCLVPTSSAAFRMLLATDYARLQALLDRPAATGPAFHATRKIVGRHVSFWNTLQTLDPTEDRYRMTRWLSAINGAMGELHDRLVERRVRNAASYDAPFHLPDDIRARMEALLGLTDERMGNVPTPA